MHSVFLRNCHIWVEAAELHHLQSAELLLLPQECYFTPVTIFSLIPRCWKLGSPWCQPLISKASARIGGSPRSSFMKAKAKRGVSALMSQFHSGFKAAQCKLKNIWCWCQWGLMPSSVPGQLWKAHHKAARVRCISRKKMKVSQIDHPSLLHINLMSCT